MTDSNIICVTTPEPWTDCESCETPHDRADMHGIVIPKTGIKMTLCEACCVGLRDSICEHVSDV